MKKLLSVVFIAALLLRFYKPLELFFWNVDEDIIGLTVKRILIDFRPQLIGFPIPGGIYLGPLSYYVISIPYLITLMDPLKLTTISAILGAFNTWFVYFVGKRIFESDKIGILAAFLFGLSGLSIVYSHILGGLSFVPSLALSVYLLIFNYVKKRKFKTFVFLVFALVAASQNEGTSLSLIALVASYLLINKVRIGGKKLLFALLVFILSQIPLLFFDIRHEFFLTRSFFSFFSRNAAFTESFVFITIKNSLEVFPMIFSRFLFIDGQKSISGQILPCADLLNERMSKIPPAMFLFSSVVLIFFMLRFKQKIKGRMGFQIVSLHLSIALAGIIIYNFFLTGYFYEWMFLILFPAFSFIAAYFLIHLFQKNVLLKVAVVVFLTIFLIWNLRFVFGLEDGFGLKAKTDAVKYALSKTAERVFYLDTIGSCYSQGYIYLFWKYGGKIQSSYADDMFTPTFYKKILAPRPKLGVVMVNPSKVESAEFWEKYSNYREKTQTSAKFGGVEVLVVED